MLLGVMFGPFDFRQPHGWWRVGERQPNHDYARESDRRRNKECESPTNDDEISAENDNQSAANRMRDIPNRHSARQFLWWKPMRQQTRARRKAHALKPTVRHPDQTHHHYGRAESKEHI